MARAALPGLTPADLAPHQAPAFGDQLLDGLGVGVQPADSEGDLCAVVVAAGLEQVEECHRAHRVLVHAVDGEALDDGAVAGVVVPPPLALLALERADLRGRPVRDLQPVGATGVRRGAGERLDRVHLVREAAHVRAPAPLRLRRQHVWEDAALAAVREQPGHPGLQHGVGAAQPGRDHRGGHHPRGVHGGQRLAALQPGLEPADELVREAAVDLGVGPDGQRHRAGVGRVGHLLGGGGGDLGGRPATERLLLPLHGQPRETERGHRGVPRVAPLHLEPHPVGAGHPPDGLREAGAVGQVRRGEAARRQLQQLGDAGRRPVVDGALARSSRSRCHELFPLGSSRMTVGDQASSIRSVGRVSRPTSRDHTSVTPASPSRGRP